MNDEQLGAVLATGVPGVAVLAGSACAAAGIANLATGEALTADHRFRIGSVTKVFVAALVLRLVAEGALELDQETAPFVDGITLRQLLNHTSGLPDFMDDPVAFFEPYRRDPSHRWELGPREELELVLAKPRLFAPGDGWSYHGSNYIVLRLVVEHATQLDFADALRRHVFSPLGLVRTALVEGPLREDCAHGYLPGDNPLLPSASGPVDVTALDVPFYRAGGGIVSTPAETAAMLRALLQGDFIPEHLRHELLQGVASDWAESDRYGLGIGLMSALMGRRRTTCGPAWGHIGFSLGYTTLAMSSEDGERQVVLCANGSAATMESSDAFWDAAGALAWQLYCASG